MIPTAAVVKETRKKKIEALRTRLETPAKKRRRKSAKVNFAASDVKKDTAIEK